MIKRPQIVIFTDRAMGKSVPEALRKAGAKVEIHDDHFPPATLDIEWLPEVSARGWVVLTKDKAISRNSLELIAIANAKARVFTLVSGQLNRQEMAAICIQALAQIEKFSTGNRPPFVAKIYKSSQVKLWKNKTNSTS